MLYWRVTGIQFQLKNTKQEEKAAAAQNTQTTTALACLDERVDRAKATLLSLYNNLGKVIEDSSGSNKILK